MEIRRLVESDDRQLFASGDDDRDRFLKRYAGQNQFRHHIGVTYVAVEKGRVIGFATVAASHVEIDRLSAALRSRLPAYPLPVLRLARLAVDAAVRGSGVGRSLLRYVLNLAVRMADDFGCIGVVVDAKPGMAEFYSKLGFLPLEVLEGASEEKPTPTVMFLSLSAIAAARRSGT